MSAVQAVEWGTTLCTVCTGFGSLSAQTHSCFCMVPRPTQASRPHHCAHHTSAPLWLQLESMIASSAKYQALLTDTERKLAQAQASADEARDAVRPAWQDELGEGRAEWRAGFC